VTVIQPGCGDTDSTSPPPIPARDRTIRPSGRPNHDAGLALGAPRAIPWTARTARLAQKLDRKLLRRAANSAIEGLPEPDRFIGAI